MEIILVVLSNFENDLYKLAVEFRIVFQEAALPESSLGGIFPQGLCGTACDMLSKYLEQNGISTAYVFGENSNCITHAWLEYEDLIIDITADQFSEIDEKVVVTRNRCWYEQFNIESRTEKYDFLGVNSIDVHERKTLYNQIVQSGILPFAAPI